MRLRQLNGSSSTIDPIEALRKLQILPGVLQELQEKLPQLLAILTTTEISPQLHQPAARAFDLAERSFDIHIERSVSCLLFGESDVVQHVENYIGHRIYTADAAHLHRATVGFDCIVLQMTRRAGNGKVFCTASCLITKGESHEVWEAFFRFCIRLGMQLQHADEICRQRHAERAAGCVSIIGYSVPRTPYPHFSPPSGLPLDPHLHLSLVA